MKNVIRNGRKTGCQKHPFAALLRDELQDDLRGQLTQHLTDCETCQRRLTETAAEPNWWLDASRWLESADEDLDSAVACGDDDFTDPFSGGHEALLQIGLLAKCDKPGVLGVLGRYEIKRVIGMGGTGIVLQACDLELNRTVAIKVLAPSLAVHGPARRRFAREGKAVAVVAHENVVAVHHVEASSPIPYLVMQYVDGNSLQDVVIRDGPLEVTTTLRMVAQIAAALDEAHAQGLVHRDVKPANILVGATGQRIWITDFGLARAVDDASLTRTGFIAGTPHYMSPEQARGEAVRASSDLFGLGSVLYFILTGRPPFRAERTLAILNRICTEPHRPIREVNPDVPTSVVRLVDRLLAKACQDRFADASAVRTECLRLLSSDTWLEDEPMKPAAGAASENRPRARRKRILVIAALAMLVITAEISLYAGAFRAGIAARTRIVDPAPEPIPVRQLYQAEPDGSVRSEASAAYEPAPPVVDAPVASVTAAWQSTDGQRQEGLRPSRTDSLDSRPIESPRRLPVFEPYDPLPKELLRAFPPVEPSGRIEPSDDIAALAIPPWPGRDGWTADLSVFQSELRELELKIQALPIQTTYGTDPTGTETFSESVRWLVGRSVS